MKKKYIPPRAAAMLSDTTPMMSANSQTTVEDIKIVDTDETVAPEDALSKRFEWTWDEDAELWSN